jgi:hypothetical protein
VAFQEYAKVNLIHIYCDFYEYPIFEREIMRENRRVQRVDLLSSGWLYHNGTKYSCRLENISRNGALVCLKIAPSGQLHPGDKCNLTLHQPDQEPQYHEIEAQVVRVEFNVTALEFTELETDSHDKLINLIQKELHFLEGGQKLIDLGREVAELKGIGLTAVYFDKGELNPEREMHTLRLSAGEQSINVHMHRDEIEEFYVPNDSKQTKAKIYHAIERLAAM